MLLVDDGSPDKCGEICDQYEKMDERIRVFHNENMGVSRARAYGVVQSSSPWISFVDPDDTLIGEALETLYNGICNTESELIVGTWKETFREDFVMSLQKYKHATVLGRDPLPTSCVWGKLYKRTLFTDYVLDVPRFFVRGQDKIMNLRIVFHSLKTDVKFVAKPVYNYRIHPKSRIQTFKTNITYEASFYEAMLDAISNEDISMYMLELVCTRLDVLRAIAWNTRNDSWKKSAFVKKLIEDIHNYDLYQKIGLKNKLVLSKYTHLYIVLRKIYETIYPKQKSGFLK